MSSESGGRRNGKDYLRVVQYAWRLVQECGREKVQVVVLVWIEATLCLLVGDAKGTLMKVKGFSFTDNKVA